MISTFPPVLDLAPILEGQSVARTFANTLDLARHAERLNYKRFWLAEHHNIPSIASAATSVVIGYVAGGNEGDPRRRRRDHAAESCTAGDRPRAVRHARDALSWTHRPRFRTRTRNRPKHGSSVASRLQQRRRIVSAPNVLELQGYLAPETPGQRLRAIPGAGTNVPVWLLGSSLFSAQLAAALGLPFAFASHFAPQLLLQALEYLSQDVRAVADACIALRDGRNDHRCGRYLGRGSSPAVHIAPAVIREPAARAADADAAADRHDGWLLDADGTRNGGVGDDVRGRRRTRNRSAASNGFVELTNVDEIIVMGQTYDHAARLRSFEIVAGARDAIAASV